jgi:hypothetical protein
MEGTKVKFLKGLFTFFVILVILGGLVYIGYAVLERDIFQLRVDTTPNAQMEETNQDNMNMKGMDNSAQENVKPALPNPYDAQNREKMTQAIGMIDQALELITIDPYSKATMPSSKDSMQMDSMQGQEQGNGTINIYPSDNSSVNIGPSENNTDSANNEVNATDAMQGNMDSMTMNQSNNYVYDQGKLQQLHSGIFTMAQGVLAINELNDDLIEQSMMVETNPLSYQTYVLRYSTALKNKTNLENAVEMLSQASVLININPYASQNGYAYNNDSMKQLHEGIYKLAQGMALLKSLNNDFTTQMTSATLQAQNIVYNNQISVDDMGYMGYGMFENISISTVINLVIIVLVAGLIIGILGAISSLFKKNKKNIIVNRDYEEHSPTERG